MRRFLFVLISKRLKLRKLKIGKISDLECFFFAGNKIGLEGANIVTRSFLTICLNYQTWCKKISFHFHSKKYLLQFPQVFLHVRKFFRPTILYKKYLKNRILSDEIKIGRIILKKNVVVVVVTTATGVQLFTWLLGESETLIPSHKMFQS